MRVSLTVRAESGHRERSDFTSVLWSHFVLGSLISALWLVPSFPRGPTQTSRHTWSLARSWRSVLLEGPTISSGHGTVLQDVEVGKRTCL